MIYGSRDPETFKQRYKPGQSGPFGVLEPIHYPNHDANPILVAFRDDEEVDVWLWSLDSWDEFGGYTVWDDPNSRFHALCDATQEHIDHARRVLERLVVR
jgi:hypothetical protein